MHLNVRKRDGSIEPYSPEKIARIMKAAGLSEENIHKLINELELWAKAQKKDVIDSTQIRDQVVTQLKNLDPYVYNMFIWYQKTKDKK